ncbi:MAG: GNAT family N-acetyltransferase [Rhizobiaceae bacterium]
MSGHFGTQTQRRLQAQAEASVAYINATPGTCQAGRMMACDDPDRLGWGRINEFLERDGVCGFRLISANKAEEVRSHLISQDCRFDTWEVFTADRTTAVAASKSLLNRGLPDGLVQMAGPTDPDSEYTKKVHTLMATAGVVPFSGSFLTGALGPARTVVVGDRNGNVLAAAHGYLPHNAFSDYQHYAWGGLVAVAEAERGKGLGNYVNACMIASMFEDIGATHVYELVSATNTPSRKMVASCGLRAEPALVCGVAAPNDSARFTR